MEILGIGVTYFGVAIGTAGYAYYKGVAMHGRDPMLGFEQHVTLLLSAVVVGFLWVAFLPFALLRAIHEIRPVVDGRIRKVRLGGFRTIRARG